MHHKHVTINMPISNTTHVYPYLSYAHIRHNVGSFLPFHVCPYLVPPMYTIGHAVVYVLEAIGQRLMYHKHVTISCPYLTPSMYTHTQYHHAWYRICAVQREKFLTRLSAIMDDVVAVTLMDTFMQVGRHMLQSFFALPCMPMGGTAHEYPIRHAVVHFVEAMGQRCAHLLCWWP